MIVDKMIYYLYNEITYLKDIAAMKRMLALLLVLCLLVTVLTACSPSDQNKPNPAIDFEYENRRIRLFQHAIAVGGTAKQHPYPQSKRFQQLWQIRNHHTK